MPPQVPRMPRDLLERFARLLTTDTDACAGLFALDAVYRARLGSCEVILVGREQIRRFLAHVPRQIAVQALEPQPEQGASTAIWRGDLVLSATDLAPRRQPVRFAVQAGRFRSFEQLAPSANGTA